MMPPLAERAFAIALRLMPRSFDAYRDDMAETFARRADDARLAHPLAVWLLLGRELAGLGRVAVVTRLAARGRAPARNTASPSPIAGIRRELRHASRRLRRTPGFTAAALVTVALVLGANAAVYTLLDQVVLAPLPYPSADRLISLDHSAPGVGLQSGIGMSIGTYREYARVPSIEAIALYDVGEGTLVGTGDAEHVTYLYTTPSLGGLLGMRPALGRWFTDAEGVTGAPSVVVLGDALWRTRFGGAASVIGSIIRLDGRVYEVIGVLPPDVAFPDTRPQLVIPLPLPATWGRAAGFNYQGLARLAPGVRLDQARRQLDAVIADLPSRYPGDPEAVTGMIGTGQMASRPEPFKAHLLGQTAGNLWMLLGAAAVVLLMGCANLANLFLVRADARQREVALRRAMGARRISVAMYYLSETLLIAITGGVLGLVLSQVAVAQLIVHAPLVLPRLHEVHLSAGALAFTALVAVASGVLLALLPLVRSGRGTTTLLQRIGRPNLTGAGGVRSRHVLMAAQVSFAVVLLAAAGLMVRSFNNLLQVDPGFQGDHRLVFRVALPRSAYRTGAAAAAFQARALEQLQALPGTRAAALTSTLPLDGQGRGSPLEVRGRQSVRVDETPVARFRRVSTDYFGTMAIRRARGQLLDEVRADTAFHPVVVNEALARLYFGDAEPVGQQVRALGEPDQEWLTIVGVVANTVTHDLYEPTPIPQLFIGLHDPARGNVPAPHDMAFVLRVDGEPSAWVAPVRAAMASLDPAVAVVRPERLDDVVARARADTTFVMILLLVAAAVGLVLGTVGVYAVIAYAVTQRSLEIGVRIALGATPGEVSGMIVRQGAPVIVLGILVGLACSFASTRALRALLVGIRPTDAPTHLGVAATLLCVALVACWLPARRASRLDPVKALRGN